jgi:hypothetical protein
MAQSKRPMMIGIFIFFLVFDWISGQWTPGSKAKMNLFAYIAELKICFNWTESGSYF